MFNSLDDLEWYDLTQNWVLKKERIKNHRLLSRHISKMHWENLSGEEEDEYVEFELGVSKMSYKVAYNDEVFINYQDEINKTKYKRIKWGELDE